jgi:hypothetical protein
MRPAFLGAVSGPSSAITRLQTKEKRMRAYSLNELFYLTRAELFALHAKIVTELSMLSDADRAVALDNLRNVRRVLAHPRASP